MAVDTEALDSNYLVSLEDIRAAYDALSLKEEAVIALLDQISADQLNGTALHAGITSRSLPSSTGSWPSMRACSGAPLGRGGVGGGLGEGWSWRAAWL